MKAPCPECGVEVEARVGTSEANYLGPIVWRGLQFRTGPEHRSRCLHWRKGPAEVNPERERR
jgi:hypothetical protein